MRRSPAPLSGLFALITFLVLGSGCADRPATEPETRAGSEFAPQKFDIALMRGKEPSAELGSPRTELLEEMSRALRGRGVRLAVSEAEALTVPEGSAEGLLLLASNHALRFPSRWVPEDARRRADGHRISYLVVNGSGVAKPGLLPAVTEAAVDRALATWAGEVPCVGIEIVKRPDTGADATVIDYAMGMGGYGDPYLADVVNAGFWPAEFFERLATNGSRYILGVTFTVVFTDENGDPTDLDRDGCLDVALKEIYYNNRFNWGVDGGFSGIDLETVALHENGHALGLAHFGNIFVTKANGVLHFTPRAVMNAAYVGALRHPQRTDRAAICGIYAGWPGR